MTRAAAIPAWCSGATTSSSWCGCSCPKAPNEARLIDQIETHINKVVELGFLPASSPPAASTTAPASFEVRRILKAFVDAQWLADFDARLATYRAALADRQGDPVR